MDCSLPSSSVHGILQARILEWVAIPFSRVSSWPRDWTLVSWLFSCIGKQILYYCATCKALEKGYTASLRTFPWNFCPVKFFILDIYFLFTNLYAEMPSRKERTWAEWMFALMPWSRRLSSCQRPVRGLSGKKQQWLRAWDGLGALQHTASPGREEIASMGKENHSVKARGDWGLSQINPQTCAAAAAAKSLQSCLTLCNPIDSTPPGSSVPGSLQVRTLEWVAISFSNAWKWKVKVNSLSHVPLFATPWTAAHQAPPSMGLSRLEYWSGVPFSSPRPVKGIIYSPGNNSLPLHWRVRHLA